jgi:hypothetical protein
VTAEPATALDRLPRARPRSIVGRIARPAGAGAVLWVVAVAVVAAPAAFSLPGAGLDPSWEVALQMAMRRHLQWGTDVVWTYGPYGFAEWPVYVYFGTWVAGTAITLTVHLLFCSTLAIFLWKSGVRWWGWLLLGLVFLLPVTSPPSIEFESGISAVLLLALGLASPGRSPVPFPVVLAGALLALITLIRGTGLVETVGVTLAFAVASVICRRWTQTVTLVASLLGSFVLLWLVAGQALSGVPAYVRTSYEVAAGYTAAMSLVRETANPFTREQLVPALFVVILAAAAVAAAFLRRDRLTASLAWLGLPFIILGFKQGFVRGGSHQLYFYMPALLLQTPVLLAALRARDWMAGGLAAAAAITCAALLGFGGRFMAPADPQPVWAVQSLEYRAQTYPVALRLLLEPALRAQTTQSSVAQMRAFYQVPDAMLSRLRSGTVDIAPFDSEIAYAYGLDWRPRPVLQSYAAYTPFLDGLDAAHLSGAAAPDRVLYSFAAIDARYPMFEEPQATWALLHRYRVEQASDRYLLLVRTGNASIPALRGLGSVNAQLSQPVAVPGGPRDVRASIDVSYSARGRLLDLAFRPSELHVSFVYDNGTVSPQYRLIPRTAGDGVAVGWYIADAAELPAYVEGHPTRRIRSFMITADNPADYASNYEVTFYGPP